MLCASAWKGPPKGWDILSMNSRLPAAYVTISEELASVRKSSSCDTKMSNAPSVTRQTRKIADDNLSRKLSYALRHGAVQLRLPMNSAGFVPVAALRTNMRGLKSLTDETLHRIVEENEKMRFSLWTDEEGHLHIRANQGHSGAVATQMDPNKLLQPLAVQDLPTVCVHGTALDAWSKIRETGLSTMNRDMIHFAIGLPGDHTVVSGMRNTSQVLIFVSLANAIRDGVPFYRSENQVLLSPGVGDSGVLPIKYFEKVIRRDTGQVLMQNADLT